MSPDPDAGPTEPVLALPPVRRAHLAELSALGPIGQHAIGPRPDPAHGSCTDDVARAMEVDLLHAAVVGWEAVEGSAWNALRYLDEAVDEDSGRFRNFRERRGRVARGRSAPRTRTAARCSPSGGRCRRPRTGRSARTRPAIFRRALPGTVGLTFLHARSSALIGCAMAARTDADDRLARRLDGRRRPARRDPRGRLRAGRVVGNVAVAGVERHLRIGPDAAGPDRRGTVDRPIRR